MVSVNALNLHDTVLWGETPAEIIGLGHQKVRVKLSEPPGLVMWVPYSELKKP